MAEAKALTMLQERIQRRQESAISFSGILEIQRTFSPKLARAVATLDSAPPKTISKDCACVIR